LLDGPSLLLIALAVLAAEKGRPLISAAITGIAALGRETNVLAVLAQPFPRTGRAWRHAAFALLIVVLPVIIWMDYLWSIYRSNLLTGTDQMTMPATAFSIVLVRVLRAVLARGFLSNAGLDLSLLAGVVVQTAFILIRREWTQPWWRVAAGYVLLALVLDRVLWDPHTGAIARVLLPLTAGFNVQLARDPHSRGFWRWFVAGNLSLLGIWKVMPLV
jgi:hypothetical protein